MLQISFQSSYRRARASPQIWQKNVARSYERPEMCVCVCCMRTVLNSTVGPAQSLHTWKNLQLLPPSHAFGSTKRPERIFNQGYHIFCNTRSLYPPLLCLLLPPLGFFSAAYSMPSILLHHRPPPHEQGTQSSMSCADSRPLFASHNTRCDVFRPPQAPPGVEEEGA